MLAALSSRAQAPEAHASRAALAVKPYADRDVRRLIERMETLPPDSETNLTIPTDEGANMTPKNTDPTPEEPDSPTETDLQEPSTEKEPGREPRSPESDDQVSHPATPEEPEPSHEAIGIGVIGVPTEPEHEPDAD